MTGGCVCGGVRYEVSEPLVSASYCHCTRCQRRTGTGSSANARIVPGSLRIVAGEELVRTWEPPDGVAKGLLLCMRIGALEPQPGRPRPAQRPARDARRGSGHQAELPPVRHVCGSHGSRFRTTGCRAIRRRILPETLDSSQTGENGGTMGALKTFGPVDERSLEQLERCM